MSDEKWPRPADITDDLTDGTTRRVWYVGERTDCTHVEVWMPDKAVLMFFSAKGCVDVTKYHNGDTPQKQSGASDPDYVHVCDVPEFAATLIRGLSAAHDYWHKI